MDSDDRIVGVSHEWTSFALANGGEKVLPDRILGRDLWSQISDNSVREIYRMIMRRARAGNTIRFRYRCDSAIFRRTFEMTVRPGPNSAVEFQSELVVEEPRARMNLFEEAQARDDRVVRVCSWCQRVATDERRWVEVEDAVKAQAYLEHATLPQVSHGICPECTTRTFGDLGEPEGSPN